MLRHAECQTLVCTSASEAVTFLGSVEPDLLILSLDLEGVDACGLIRMFRRRAPEAPILATISAPDMALAVRATHAGASDVLLHPVDGARLVAAAKVALEQARQHTALRAPDLNERHGFSHMLTRSPRMLRVFDQIRAVATTDATVLIRGETGTGKELVSRAIHDNSRRCDRPFIGINCGAFTETLLESELFGHEKGSFTGAGARRRGVFEMADGGSLFLDELGETSHNVQVNLLRVLEEMRFRRVGGQQPIHVNVRIIAATNVNLEEAVPAGRFREDLYYRLNVFPIHLPPLRERSEDIPLLAGHFLRSVAEDYGLETPSIAPEALDHICRYRWPGNVRQLRAMCERWVILARGGEISPQMLPTDMRADTDPDLPCAELSIDASLPLKAAIEQTTRRIERAYLHRTLERNAGHLRRTSEAAGITRRTLYNKMKAYGLIADDYRPRK